MLDFPVSVNKTGVIPIYRQIEETIRENILSGKLQPHDRLPSENELSQSLNVSPMTIRQAMSSLVQSGYVYRERGKGTFVALRPMVHPLTRLVGFTEDMRARGLQPGSKILVFERIQASSEVADSLSIEPGTSVLRIKRLRLANNYSVGIHDTFLSDLSITRQELDETGSLYELLGKKGLAIMRGQDEIESISANEEMSRLLHVPLKSPLLFVRRISHTVSDIPIELVHAIYRSDFYRYKIQLER